MMSEAKLYKALADFQQEVSPIFKGTSGYGYKYADWSEILKVVNPLLAKHSLGFSQPLDGSKVTTVVFHSETGESIQGSVDIPQGVQLKGMNDFQVLGSAITYLRRYSLSSILGLVTDEDADAAGQQTRGAASQTKWMPSKNKAVSESQRTHIAEALKLKGVEGRENITAWMYDNYGSVPENEADAQMILDDLTAEAKANR